MLLLENNSTLPLHGLFSYKRMFYSWLTHMQTNVFKQIQFLNLKNSLKLDSECWHLDNVNFKPEDSLMLINSFLSSRKKSLLSLSYGLLMLLCELWLTKTGVQLPRLRVNGRTAYISIIQSRLSDLWVRNDFVQWWARLMTAAVSWRPERCF